MTPARAALAVAWMLAACSPDPRTEVFVTVAAEPDVVALAPRLLVTLRSSDARGLVVTGSTVDLGGTVVAEETLGSASEPVAYPIDVAIVPAGNDASRRYWLELTALAANGDPVAQLRTISGFIRGRTLALRLVLESRCVGEFSCENAETCRAANCESAVVDAASLPDHTAAPDVDASVSPSEERWTVGPTIKARQSTPYQTLGRALAIDGNLLAVGMPGNASDASGVRPLGELHSQPPYIYESGAVAIFRRDAHTGVWSQEAFIKPDCPGDAYHFGASLALSGSVLVVGSPDDGSAGATCSGTSTLANSGSAYVYRRGSNGTWTREAYLRSPSPHAGDLFGYSVDVSLDRIVVAAPDDDSNAATSASTPDPWTGTARPESGSVFVFRRAGSDWALDQHLKSSAIEDDGSFGHSVAIDGTRIAVGAPAESPAGWLYVFENDGAAWSEAARLVGSRAPDGQAFGRAVAIDGNTVVATQRYESSGGADVDPDPTLPANLNSGATYVFVVDANDDWSEQAFIKAHFSTNEDTNGEMSVDLDADRLAIGYPGEDSSTTGLGSTSDAVDATDRNTGAVFVYRRAGATWSFDAYVKSSLSQSDAEFGYGVGLSYPWMVVGAPFEDSDGTSVASGPPTENPSAPSAGTVYGFVLAP